MLIDARAKLIDEFSSQSYESREIQAMNIALVGRRIPLRQVPQSRYWTIFV